MALSASLQATGVGQHRDCAGALSLLRAASLRFPPGPPALLNAQALIVDGKDDAALLE
jgi:hypothetical protein